MDIDRIKRNLREHAIVGPLYRLFASARAALRSARLRSAFDRYGEDSFRIVVRSLDSAGILGFPAFGTLLGLVRESRLIPGDYDLDFAVITEGGEYGWSALVGALERAGFSILRWFEYNGIVQEVAFTSPLSSRINVDFFTFARVSDGYVTHLFCRYADGEYGDASEMAVLRERLPHIDGFKCEEHLGVNVHTPANSEALLEATYGPSWRTPDPSWRYMFAPSNVMVEGATAYVHWGDDGLRERLTGESSSS